MIDSNKIPSAHCSIFADGKKKIPFTSSTLEEIVTAIRCGEIAGKDFKELIAAIREGRGDKRELPAFAASVFCKTRAKDASEEEKGFVHTGLIQCDFDGKDHPAWNMAETYLALTEDPHSMICKVSPSGTGIKAFVPIPPDLERHLESWHAVANYFLSVHNLKVDRATKDPGRLCFFSYDPAAYFNPEAEMLDVSKWGASPQPEDKEQDIEEVRESQPAAALETFSDNDAGRAARFCERWQDEVLYVPQKDCWFVWDGRWQRDSTGGIRRRAIELANEIMRDVLAQPARSKDELKRQASQIANAARWGNENTIRPMLALAQTDLRVQASVNDLDADPWLLGTLNAIIDLRTGEAREHSPADLVTKFCGCEFDPSATAPRWAQFLTEIFPDREILEYIWRAVGYSATGCMGEEVFHVLFSAVGRNGKSKFISAICHVLGDYADTVGIGLIVANERGDDPKGAKAKIVGKRFLRAPETDERQKLNTAIIKDISGGDALDAEAKYEHPFTFKPVGKLWLATNYKPVISDTGNSIWERVRLIPFERYFAPEERDIHLEEKLRAEAPGILNWIIQGALLWQRDGLKAPERIRAAVEDYRREEDTLADFLEEHTAPDLSGTIMHAELFARYTEWAKDTGVRYTLTSRLLSKRLHAKQWVSRPSARSKVNWIGVSLLK